MVLCDFKKSHSNVPLLFLPLALKPSSFFFNNQNDVWLWQCGMHTMCKRRRVVLWNGQKARGSEFESEER